MSDSFADPWTVAHEAPPFIGFPRQEYWTQLPFTSPGDLPKPGTEPTSPALQADSLPPSPWESPRCLVVSYKNRLAIRNRENVKEKEKTSRAKERRGGCRGAGRVRVRKQKNKQGHSDNE